MNDYAIAQHANLPSANDIMLRILWVKVGGLWPVNTGGRLRSFHLLNELSRRHDISVITTHHSDEAPETLALHLPHCRRVTSLPNISVKRNSPQFIWTLICSWFSALPVDLFKCRNPALDLVVKEALDSNNFDICVADFLFAVPNVPLGSSVPVIFFAHNVEYMIWQRLGDTQTNILHKVILAVEWRKMRSYESWACANANLTVAVSEQDRMTLNRMAPSAPVRAIPTGVDTKYFMLADPENEIKNSLVFTGSMDWHPNEDAIMYFIAEILPLVRRVIPTVSLTVVGRNPGKKLRQVAMNADVRVTGTVDDVRPWMETAALYIVPLRIGGGTRLKIYEALAMGKAVVSTSIGAEGLPLQEGVHIVRADTSFTFSESIIHLLSNRQQRSDLGKAGRKLMEQHYSWSRVADDFEKHCRTVVPI